MTWNDRHASLSGPRIRLLGRLFLATWALIAICSAGWVIYAAYIESPPVHNLGQALAKAAVTILGVFGLLIVIGTAMFVRGWRGGRALMILLLPLHIAAGCYITFDSIRSWVLLWSSVPYGFADAVLISLSALFTLMGMALMFAVLTAGRGVGRDR